MANVRTQGHNFERKIVQIITQVFGFKSGSIKTSRSESKSLDDAGIDIWSDPSLNFPFSIQCKKKLSKGKDTISIDVAPLFRISTNIPVLITKITKKATTREQEIATVVTIKLEDFLKLSKVYYDHR